MATVLGDQYVTIGVGTTAQRPGSPSTGMIRYNTTLGIAELYDGSTWVPLSVQTFNTLEINDDGDLIHTVVSGSDSNYTVSEIEDKVAAFMAGSITLDVTSAGDLTISY
jgi:hypothetical protein